jgi:Secretion system C-terminal sorting domain
MKKTFYALAFLFCASSYAQFTAIPDLNFEKALIASEIDSGIPNGKVLTASIRNVLSLNVISKQITSLKGIEGFTMLTTLLCDDNQITSLDLSSNPSLTAIQCPFNLISTINVSRNLKLNRLSCYRNKLTSLNVANNIALRVLNVGDNLLTSLDVSRNVNLVELYTVSNQLIALDISQNIALNQFYCNDNKITTIDLSKNTVVGVVYVSNNKLNSIDISKNTNVYKLVCNNNSLTSLNLKNGNTKNLSVNFKPIANCDFRNNPNLTCIQVDSAVLQFLSLGWNNVKDPIATYRSNCAITTPVSAFLKTTVYPVPATSVINIDNVVLDRATLYDSTGQLVRVNTAVNKSSNNTINISNLPKGLYTLILESNGEKVSRKVVLE